MKGGVLPQVGVNDLISQYYLLTVCYCYSNIVIMKRDVLLLKSLKQLKAVWLIKNFLVRSPDQNVLIIYFITWLDVFHCFYSIFFTVLSWVLHFFIAWFGKMSLLAIHFKFLTCGTSQIEGNVFQGAEQTYKPGII